MHSKCPGCPAGGGWWPVEIGVWLSGEAWDETATQQLVKATRRNEISQGDVLSGKTRRAKDKTLGSRRGEPWRGGMRKR